MLLLFPTIYRAKGEGEAQPLPLPPRKGAAKGGEESILPKAPRRCLPPLGLSLFPLLLAHGPLGAGALGPLRLGRPPTAHAAILDVVEHFPDLRTPPESSGAFWKRPGTIPMTPKLVPMAEIALPIYNSLPPDHSGTPRDIRDLIRDSEQHSVITYKSS